MAASAAFPSDQPDFPRVLKVTVSPNTADDVRAVTIPRGTKTVTLYFETNAGKVAFQGTDDAAIEDDYVFVAADTHFEMKWQGNADRDIYLASGTAATVCRVAIEDR